MYKTAVNPAWKTADLLANFEETIYTVVCHKNPGAAPPQLKFDRVGQNSFEFHYDSPRKMAPLAVGIMKGEAKHFGE